MQNKIDKEEVFLEDLRTSLAEQVREGLAEEREEKMGKKKEKKKGGLFFKIFLTLLVILVLLGGFLTFTPMGRKLLTRLAVEYMYSKLDVKSKKKKKSKTGGETGLTKEEQEEELVKGEITENIDLSEMSDTFKNALHEEGVYNILLLGVEAIFENSSKGGRTDSIMIATINTKKKTLGLTSLMRDSIVTIPGYKKNRINTAFARGGEKQVYETIAENYGLRLDGSAIVDFNTFQQVIDDIGGVEIEITKAEAQYLNTKNYISKKENRNLKPGVNLMNGNQALGYSRIRKVPTLDGSHSDMGRTSRHRRVMTAIFKKIKKSNPASLIGVMNNVLPKIKTDVTKSNATSYLAELLELSIDGVSLDTLRLPEDDALFRDTSLGFEGVGVDWTKTRTKLADFIFGDRKKPEEAEKEKKQS